MVIVAIMLSSRPPLALRQTAFAAMIQGHTGARPETDQGDVAMLKPCARRRRLGRT